jgi:hypothetical protein
MTIKLIGLVRNWIYIILIIIGLVVASLFGLGILTLVNNGNIAGLSLGLSLVALGWNLLITQHNLEKDSNSQEIEKQLKENNELIKEIKNKLDSGIIFSQNTIVTTKDGISNKIEMSLFYRGIGIGALTGIIGGMFTTSMFEIINYGNKLTAQSHSFPIIQAFIFIISVVTLIGLILYLANLIEKVESSDSCKVV